MLLNDARDPGRFTSFGVFPERRILAPWPAFLERLGRVRALCESSPGHTYAVVTAGHGARLAGVELNGHALSPVAMS